MLEPSEVLYAISMKTDEFVGEVDVFSTERGNVAVVSDILGRKHYRRVTNDLFGLKVWACDLLGIDLFDTELNTSATSVINGLAF